jgi:hypothetical protein
MKTKKGYKKRGYQKRTAKKHLKKALFDAAKVHPASLILSTNRVNNRSRLH